MPATTQRSNSAARHTTLNSQTTRRDLAIFLKLGVAERG
jgi:hypothetical protein